MSILDQEVKNIINPALGSILIWRFMCGYAEGSKISNTTPIPLLFIILPITLYKEISHFINRTLKKSGLRAFVSKFSESANAKNDLVLEVHERAIKMRYLTLESMRLAIAAKLISIDNETGMAIPLSLTKPAFGIPSSITKMLNEAEKLGFWCSEVSMHEISVILKVGF